MPANSSRKEGRPLSYWEWSVLLSKATSITFGLLFKTFGVFFGRRKSGLTFHQSLGYAGVRDYQSGLDAVGIQHLLPSTSRTCVKFARKHGIEHSQLRLADGTIAQWLGSRKAARIVVFFHGGGYMSPALSEHLFVATGLAQAPRGAFSTVVLQYDLASDSANHYPRQLQQAVTLMDHLLRFEEISPSTITLMGDSAGAHLLLGLIIHISHCNPMVSPLQMSGPFSNAVLISPWVKLNSSAPSLHSNKYKDILTTEALSYWARNFMGRAPSDYWNDPLTIPPRWWGDLPVAEILVLYGDHELIRDDTSAFCETLKAHHPRTTAWKLPGEIHAHMVINRFLKIDIPCESERIFIQWMNDHLQLQINV